MSINEENIEIIILDYFEGNLLPNQIDELFAFLNLNLNWKKVFDEFVLITLDEEAIILKQDFKLNLKKSEFDSNLINEVNIDDYFARSIEDDLNENEKYALYEFLEKNPQYIADYKLYKLTKLDIDKSINFKYKSFLRFDVNQEVNIGNIDLFLIKQLENDLTPSEEKAVNIFLYQYPQYLKDKKLYSYTKLLIEEQVLYPFKNRIKKELKTPIFTLFVKYSSVAAVILLATFYVNINNIVNSDFNQFMSINDTKDIIKNISIDLDNRSEYIEPSQTNSLKSFASNSPYNSKEDNYKNDFEEYIQVQNVTQAVLNNKKSIDASEPNINDYYYTQKPGISNKKIYKNIQESNKSISNLETNDHFEKTTISDISNLKPEEKIYINNYYTSSIKATTHLPDLSNFIIEKINEKAGTDLVEKTEGNKNTLNWRNVLYATVKLIKEKTQNSSIIKRKDQETSEIIAIKIGDIEIGRSFSK